MNILNVTIKAGKTSKKSKFAVYVDDTSRGKFMIKKLKYLVKEQYPYLKEEGAFFFEKSFRNMTKNNVIVFGTSNKYDYTVMLKDTFIASDIIPDSTTVLSLVDEWKQVKKAIRKYAKKNYPQKFNNDTCFVISPKKPVATKYVVVKESAPRFSACDLLCGNAIITTKPAPKRRVKPVVKKRASSWNVKVNLDYVLLTNGTDYETRDIYTVGGYEYVKIDGVTYGISRDGAGKGILTDL